jgi:tRNA(Ile)-lysidine synthase
LELGTAKRNNFIADLQLDVHPREWPVRRMAKRAAIPGDWDASILRQWPTQRRYLIGVSGGRDSVALLHWLYALGFRNLIVCHLEHGLRGRAGKADARFVERLATRLELPCESKSDDVKARAAKSKSSIETAARHARYEFFAQIARRRRCHTIFLGHHADDLVETFLFNLLRGSGSAGQGSIRGVSKQKVDGVELTIVRPLLLVWRDEIDAYVKMHQLHFREDASNRSLAATRNRIRHRIIPMLEKELGRPVRQNLWRAAAIAAEEHLALEEMLPPGLRETKKLSVAALQKLTVALQRRVIRNWLREQAVIDVGFELIEKMRATLDPSQGPAKINLPDDRHGRRRAGYLFLE